MPDEASEKAIRAYWNGQAEKLGIDPSATMPDVIVRAMEIDSILNRLDPDDELLDIGCGNAFGSLRFAERCRSVVTADYSEKMVAAAQEAVGVSGRDNIRVEQADVLDLSTYAGRFTAASCIRCLINLPSAEKQRAALEQIAATLRPDGRLFLIEGMADNFAELNTLRGRFGLSPMTVRWHNRFFPTAELETVLSDLLTIEERVDFGEYYFLSRVVHPLVVAPNPPRYDAKINHVAKSVWDDGAARGKFESISQIVLYVCRKGQPSIGHPTGTTDCQ